MQLLWTGINLVQFGTPGRRIEEAASSFDARTPFHYFLLSFPVELVHGIVQRTNAAIIDTVQNHDRIPLLTAQAFFKLIGLLYILSLRPLSSLRRDWNGSDSPLFPSCNLGRFMKVTHFEQYLKLMSWSQRNDTDAWWAIRDWFVAFNKRRVSTVQPSDRMTVDELMSANRTNKTVKNGVREGLPHQTKIARKPEGVGCEIRCLIDGRAQVMMQLELQETKQQMAQKKFLDVAKASTASVLRLVEPWFNTGRTIYGDSAFGSVATAVHLRQRGLHFFGMVKTAHREFPKAHFTSLHLELRSGESRYLTATKDNVELIAVCWWDKCQKFFISTAGSNGPAPPHCRTRYRQLADGSTQRYEKSTPISLVPYEYFSFAQKVDVHNHRRQGILAMERAIETRKWAFRLVCTLLGIIMVDAYKMYQSELRSYGSPTPDELSFEGFTKDVAGCLVNNQLVDGRQQRSTNEASEVHFEDETREDICVLVPLGTALPPDRRKRKQIQRLCVVCKNDYASFCCKRCSRTKIAAICGPRSRNGENCFRTHCMTTQG